MKSLIISFIAHAIMYPILYLNCFEDNIWRTIFYIFMSATLNVIFVFLDSIDQQLKKLKL